MAYRLVENKGDSVAVPQLVIAKLPELEDDWLRVALFVVATGETDPARIAAALRLKSPERAQTALVYWKGAGLLESCGEPQARGGIDAAPAPRAERTDKAADRNPIMVCPLSPSETLPRDGASGRVILPAPA